MTKEEYLKKMFPPAKDHKPDCDWHCDQYWWECTCGLIPVAELQAERERRFLLKTAQDKSNG